MKRILYLLVILVALSSACSPRGGQKSEKPDPPARKSGQRCGDGVCDGPENPQKCPEDCPAGAVDAQGDSVEDSALTVESQPVSTSAELTYGYVFSEVVLDRTPGNGTCGISPWGDDPGCTMDIKVWWGLHLEAFAQTPVLMIADGQDRWVITNHADVAAEYGLSLADFKEPEAGYRAATIDFSPTPECSGSVTGNDFDFQVVGTRTTDKIELVLSADPVEHFSGDCAGAGFDYQINHLLYGWAEALSGDPLDLTGVLLESNQQGAGDYLHQITIDTNPSPENRDRVSVELGLICLGGEGANAAVLEPVACPWEQ